MAGPSAILTLMLQPSSMSDLQIDFILAEILPKLPAKSLLRFKTVCKSFRNTITSPEFIHRHLRQSLASNNRLLNIGTTSRTLYTFDLDSLSSSVPSATFHWPRAVGSISVVGSCNGLLLIKLDNRGIFPLVLLNPSTRTYIDINSTWEAPPKINIGLGFNHFTDDYKIILVSDNNTNRNNVKTRITMIYSVNSKSWKVLEDTFSSDSLEGWHSGVLINNHLLHWRFWSPTKRKRRIGCFDVCSEQWNEDVLLPPYYYDPTHQNYLLDIGVLHGSLFSSFENRVDSCYDVWVMRDYADQQSWLKLLSITISDDLVLHGGVIPVACCGPGSSKVLLRQRNKARLFWYDKEDNAINNAEVPCLWEHQPYICNGSLVTLPDSKLLITV